MLSILLACVEPDPQKPDTAPPVRQDPICRPDADPVESPLAWDDPGAGGYAAQDVLGYAIGSFTAPLAWDDGAEGDVTLTITPEAATQTITGPQESCPVEIGADVVWDLASADGRLTAGGDAHWEVADAAYPPGGVSLSATLDRALVGVEPMNAGSTMYLRAFLDAQGVLVSVVVEEVWPLATDENRVCVRASLDPGALECHDTGESTGD